MNILILLGHLTRDFDVRTVGDNKRLLARSGIVVSQRHADWEENVYIEVEAWGQNAESLVRNFGKGDPILLRGRLHLNKWTDKTTKTEKQNHVIWVESWENVKGVGADAESQPGPC